jgi:uncharacterized protein
MKKTKNAVWVLMPLSRTGSNTRNSPGKPFDQYRLNSLRGLRVPFYLVGARYSYFKQQFRGPTMKYRIAAALLAASLTLPAAASPVTHDPASVDRENPPKTIELTIDSGGNQMNGHMYVANGPGPHPVVVMFHGFPGNEKNLDVAQALRRAGFNALFFNHRGAWGSEGAFGARSNTEDAAAAIAYVRKNAAVQRSDPAKISIFGHSLGGFTALYTGAVDTSVNCTVAVTPANLTLAVKAGLAQGLDINDPKYQHPIPGLKNYSRGSLFKEISADFAFFDLGTVMAGYKGRPLMIVSGSKDKAVPLQVQMPLVAAAQEAGAAPFVHTVMDADHSFSWNRVEFTENVVSWMVSNCQ